MLDILIADTECTNEIKDYDVYKMSWSIKKRV